MERRVGPTPPTQTPETAQPNPDELNLPERYLDLLDQPLYRRVISRVVHPIATKNAVKDALDIKTESWTGSVGYAGVDITREPGPDRFRHDLLPMTAREHRRSVQVAQHDVHHAHENIEFFRIQGGAYGINPETGLSKWRNPDGSIPAGTNRKTRRQIEHDEKRFKTLRHHIEGRQIDLLGRDDEDPRRPKRTDAEKFADEEAAELKRLQDSGYSAADIASQKEAVRRARIASAKPRKAAISKARAERLRDHRTQRGEQAAVNQTDVQAAVVANKLEELDKRDSRRKRTAKRAGSAAIKATQTVASGAAKAGRGVTKAVDSLDTPLDKAREAARRRKNRRNPR